jgi:nucleoside 2-deoxyribosyltransferase
MQSISKLFLVILFSIPLSHTSIALGKSEPVTEPVGDQQIELPVYYIYLAGPEVFLPDPIAAGENKKARIEQLNAKNNWPFKLKGLYPMDNEIPNFAPDFQTGLKIYHANIAQMDKAHFIAANMVRFRGPSMDVGTAFEMGYMRGLNKPVFAYYDAQPFYGSVEKPGLYAERVAKYSDVSADAPDIDAYGQSIENFQMPDNLMMVGALQSGIATISDDFDSLVMQIAESIISQLKHPSNVIKLPVGANQ